ncbi:hypothetical protein MBLNU457_g2822t1 [Dothideomycetes sp. NU457]
MEQPPDNLLAELSSTLGIEQLHLDSHFRGCSHDIFVLTSRDGREWSLRIARNEFAASLAERSIAIMRHISEQRPMLSIPRVISHAKNYTLLGYLEGSPIRLWNSSTLTDQERHKILDGLAIFLYQLWTCPVIDTNDSKTSYQDWLLHEVDQAICRSIRHPGWGDPIHFLRRRLRIEDVVPREGVPRLAIKHGDMNALNVLVHHGELSGVIDWDTASFVPAPAAIHHPLFIADIPGWINDGVPEDMKFHNDRLYLENAVRKLSTDDSTIADLLASSQDRQFLEMSLRNKRINEEYIKADHRKYDPQELKAQLDDFLAANLEFATEPQIMKLGALLSESTS